MLVSARVNMLSPFTSRSIKFSEKFQVNGTVLHLSSLLLQSVKANHLMQISVANI